MCTVYVWVSVVNLCFMGLPPDVSFFPLCQLHDTFFEAPFSVLQVLYIFTMKRFIMLFSTVKLGAVRENDKTHSCDTFSNVLRTLNILCSTLFWTEMTQKISPYTLTWQDRLRVRVHFSAVIYLFIYFGNELQIL